MRYAPCLICIPHSLSHRKYIIETYKYQDYFHRCCLRNCQLDHRGATYQYTCRCHNGIFLFHHTPRLLKDGKNMKQWNFTWFVEHKGTIVQNRSFDNEGRKVGILKLAILSISIEEKMLK